MLRGSSTPTEGHKKTSFIRKRNKSFNTHRRVVIRALFSHLPQHLPTLALGRGIGGGVDMVEGSRTLRAMRQSMPSDGTIFVVEQMKPADGLLHALPCHGFQ